MSVLARAVCVAAALALWPVPAAAGDVRYSGELGVGWTFTDCPELERAGLAILRCDEQRPDHALLVTGRSRLEFPAGPFDAHLGARLRLLAPRSHVKLEALDAVSELGAEKDIGGSDVHVSGTLLAGQHVEPDPRWQFLRWAYLGGLAAPWGPAILDAHVELSRTDFALSPPKNTYASIDVDQVRAWGGLRVWVGIVRLRWGIDEALSWWRGPLGDLLEELVRLEGVGRREHVTGSELELALRAHPRLLLSAGLRGEWAGGNVGLFHYRAVGPAVAAAWSSGPHTVSAAFRWMYYRFPEGVVAPKYFSNVREDNHFEVHARWEVRLDAGWGAAIALSWVKNASSDAAVYEAICALPENGGCADAEGKAVALGAIRSYSRYDTTTAEARIFVHW